MRALLVVNPKATTTNERTRDVLVRALRSEADLEVAVTRRRGHATQLTRQGAKDGVDVIVTLGGDGTINEAVNGLMGEPGTVLGPASSRPALAVVPGGSTNVFARALGLPKDPLESTGVILEGLREQRYRTIGLGLADDRYFTFCAGFGLDAAVIRGVERARLRGRTSTPTLYFREALYQYALAARHQPSITVERPGEDPETDLATAIVQNGAPWTYVGERPVDASPNASFDKGLDLLAFRSLRTPRSAWTGLRMLGRRGASHGQHVLHRHDLSEFTLTATHPQPFHVDGDYLGERQKVRFISVPESLRVIC